MSFTVCFVSPVLSGRVIFFSTMICLIVQDTVYFAPSVDGKILLQCARDMNQACRVDILLVFSPSPNSRVLVVDCDVSSPEMIFDALYSEPIEYAERLGA